MMFRPAHVQSLATQNPCRHLRARRAPSTPTLTSSSGIGRRLVAPLSSGWALPKLSSTSGAVIVRVYVRVYDRFLLFQVPAFNHVRFYKYCLCSVATFRRSGSFPDYQLPGSYPAIIMAMRLFAVFLVLFLATCMHPTPTSSRGRRSPSMSAAAVRARGNRAHKAETASQAQRDEWHRLVTESARAPTRQSCDRDRVEHAVRRPLSATS